jgi:hypothetical protein
VGVKIPAHGEKTSGSGKNWRPAYCLGSAESPAADFLLVWLLVPARDAKIHAEIQNLGSR